MRAHTAFWLTLVMGASVLAPITAWAGPETSEVPEIPEQTFSSCEGADTPCNFEPEKCPDPKTCPNYNLLVQADQGWQAGADALVHIHYWVNPDGQIQPHKPTEPWVRPDQVVAAVQAAFATWEAWNPKLRFHFEGTTDALPNPLIRDGKNVVGFSQPLLPFSASAATFHEGGHIVESDITLNATVPWIWRPCEQADDSCTDQNTQYQYFREELDELGLTGTRIQSGQNLDLQAVTTHEAGHLLGLDHAPGVESRLLTMLSTSSGGEGFGDKRHYNTLGLGDVLGLRVLYPFECPVQGQPVPPESQNVCPAITIYAP